MNIYIVNYCNNITDMTKCRFNLMTFDGKQFQTRKILNNCNKKNYFSLNEIDCLK